MNLIDTLFQPILLSLRIGLLSSIITLILGVCAASISLRLPNVIRTSLNTLLMLPLVLPPSVVGLILLVSLGQDSIIGQAAEWLFAQPIVFTWVAALIAAVVVSFPLVYQTVNTGIASVPTELKQAAQLDGANYWQIKLKIILPLAAPALRTACILAFARSLGEFGASFMVAGSIPGKTQTIATAIYSAVETNQLAYAWFWTAATVMISFGLLRFIHTNHEST